MTIKYADNILRGFAQGLAIVVGAAGSYFLFDFTVRSSRRYMRVITPADSHSHTPGALR